MAIGYSVGALSEVVYPYYKNNLTASDNLNNLTGLKFGVYKNPANANATPANNYPTNQAGVLEVLASGATNNDTCIQRYSPYGNVSLWQRFYTGTTWSNWQQFLPIAEIYKAVYPVGIEIQFGAVVNPNTLFPGTTWVQITDGRVVRSSTVNSTVDPGTAGQIGQIGGNESITLDIANLPAHTHFITDHTHTVPAHAHTIVHNHGITAHTHTQTDHTHTVPAHAHTIAHTHAIAAHSHTMAHTHSTPAHTHTGTANSAGAHSHGVARKNDNGGQGGNYLRLDSTTPDATGVTYPVPTNSAGEHTHTVSIVSGGGGTTGGSSAASTGGTALTTGGSSAANSGTQAETTTTGTSTASTGGTALTTGGSSAANSGTQAETTTTGTSSVVTGSVGSGTGFAVSNPFRRVAIWRRTA